MGQHHRRSSDQSRRRSRVRVPSLPFSKSLQTALIVLWVSCRIPTRSTVAVNGRDVAAPKSWLTSGQVRRRSPMPYRRQKPLTSPLRGEAQVVAPAIKMNERFVAIGIAGSGRVGTIALQECDRGPAGAVRRSRTAEFGRQQQRGAASAHYRFDEPPPRRPSACSRRDRAGSEQAHPTPVAAAASPLGAAPRPTRRPRRAALTCGSARSRLPLSSSGRLLGGRLRASATPRRAVARRPRPRAWR
jgi:hypothetical protein